MSSPELLSKRKNGQFFTEGNPFVLSPFLKWAEKVNLKNRTILEPFAGANNIIRTLQTQGYANKFASFDIEPKGSGVSFRDTLTDYPTGYEVCVTNPPWLAKNSAKRRGLDFPHTAYDDLYKYAMDKVLANSQYVAALIPATFLQSGLFSNRLETVIFLHDQGMFLDTDNPVCLALFVPWSTGVDIYHDDVFIGDLHELEAFVPKPSRNRSLVFNHPDGELGFIAFDSTHGPSIRFCSVEELEDYPVGNTSRMITRIKSDLQIEPELIQELNTRIKNFREQSKDVFLTPFKGLRKDGMYRRRMDYSLARNFINTYA